MPGFMLGINVYLPMKRNVDGREKPGHHK